MNRRFLIILIISVGIHLLLFAIRFQPEGSVVAGKPDLVGLVAGNTEKFTPVEIKPSKVVTVKKSSPPPQHQDLKQAQNIPPRLRTSMRSVLVSTLNEVSAPADSREEPAEVVSQEPLEAVELADVVEPNNILPENAEVGAVESAELVQGKSAPQADGIASQIVALATAVPRYADNPRPDYPKVARRKGWVGEVRLLVRVDEVGEVDRISVSHSSGYSALDRAARRAVRLWRFIPATRAGRKVASEVVIPVDFCLPGSGEAGVSAQQ